MFYLSLRKDGKGETHTKKISKEFETSEGIVKFEGELTDEEVEFVIECGLAYMLENEMLPFKQLGTDIASFQPQMNKDLN